MPIRLKILSIAIALLVVFGIVVGISAVLQEQVAHEIGGVTRYHQPLVRAIADFDVISFEYELIPLRLLRTTDASPTEIDGAVAREAAVAHQMTADLDTAAAVIAKAVDDSSLPVDSRIVFARLQGVLGPLQAKVPGFVDAGRQVMQALAAGRRDDATRLSLAFKRYEQAFGPDTAAVRRAASELTDAATVSIRRKQSAIRDLSFALFAVAACLGLGFGIFVATAVIRTLRGLVDAAKAVESGELTVFVPVRTRDEIGQLALAFNAMVGELRSKERIKDTFGKFVDPRIVSGLISSNGDDLLDHAERRVVTIFFSDIRGFTSISEQLTANAMVNLLNHYFGAVTRCIRESNGILDKYMGDGVMAFWSPPFSPGDTHAAAACLTALAQQQAIEAVQADLANITGLRRNAPELFVRMGIATGEAVVGTIGSPVSKSFTVIGDTVNLASRLEGINKVYGTRVIIADDTLRLAQHEVETREIDMIAVAGKAEPVRIHELLSPFGQLAAAEGELRGEFAAGLEAYRARDWDHAERQFSQCLKLKPCDGPSVLFVDRVRAMRASPPPMDWDGVWRFAHK
ncbi:MAG TPA: adenylate/guanylate cyclase domain-containing protein [Stellaceae bacterium]|nr:adenylate/guanylate cyclase domain-containing protein [Stellaceae bacterium]